MTMKKPLKISLIAISSILGVLLATIIVAIWVVFTPARLTPIVRDVVSETVTCHSEVGEVDLTFFSTFPDLGLRLSDVVLVNPHQDAQSDTLASLKECIAIVDVGAFLSDRSVVIKKFLIDGVNAHLHVATDGSSNFDIVPASTEEEEVEIEEKNPSSFSLSQLLLNDIEISGLSLSYVDDTAAMSLVVDETHLRLSSNNNLIQGHGNIDVDAEVGNLGFSMNDGVSEPMEAHLREFTFKTTLCGSGNKATAERLRVELERIAYSDASTTFEATGLVVDFPRVEIDSLTSAHVACNLHADQLNCNMVGEAPLTLNANGVSLNLPSVLVSDSLGYQLSAVFGMEDLKLDMGKDVYVNHLPISLSLDVLLSPDLTNIIVEPTSKLSYAHQQLSFGANVALVDSITTQLQLQLAIAPQTRLEQLWSLLPTSIAQELKGISLEGKADFSLSAGLTLHGDAYEIHAFDVNTQVNNLTFGLNDSLRYVAANNKVHAYYPSSRQKDVVAAEVNIPSFDFTMTDSINIAVQGKSIDTEVLLSDKLLYGCEWIPYLKAQLKLGELTASLDTLDFKTGATDAAVTMTVAHAQAEPRIMLSLANEALQVRMGKMLEAATGALKLKGRVAFNSKQEDLLLQYNPALDVSLSEADIRVDGVPHPIEINAIDFNFNLGRFMIHDSRLKVGDSDFRLQGEIDHLGGFLKKKRMLLGRLNFTSETTDVYQLMDIVNGFGAEDSTLVASTSEVPMTEVTSDTISADPFIVPRRVDFELNTHIKRTLVGENLFTDLGGKLTIKDGVLVLEEMGFSSKAARMQLTALYKSEFRDHLFAGLNFHLLDIEIADLIKMIPEVDTIVPMLRDFEGKAQFHLAAETNMNANYDLKLSTLKATAAIEGKDLVLLDSETFSTIAKYCMFNKKTRNVVDSISVEMAVARRKATIYPFVISMDKYQAVVAGTHNITGNMGFNYNVSITDWPLPGIHPGVDVTGDMNDLSFKLLGQGKYANLYRPEKRNVMQSKTLELKNLINSSLKRTVKPQESQEE